MPVGLPGGVVSPIQGATPPFPTSPDPIHVPVPSVMPSSPLLGMKTLPGRAVASPLATLSALLATRSARPLWSGLIS